MRELKEGSRYRLKKRMILIAHYNQDRNVWILSVESPGIWKFLLGIPELKFEVKPSGELFPLLDTFIKGNDILDRTEPFIWNNYLDDLVEFI